MNIRPLRLAGFAFLAGLVSSHAALRPAHIFQDHMVLQQGKQVPVWGWADPGSSVKVAFAGQEKSAKADDKGYWKATLDPLQSSAAGGELSIKAGAESVTLKDVLVGEVWVCSGQSNMARTLKNDAFNFPWFKDYAKDAEYPAIRCINYAADASDKPKEDFDPVVQKDIHWKPLTKDSAMDVMSLGFFFAKRLNKELGVPIGLVQVAVPGTPQTAWIARETFDVMNKKVPASPTYEATFAKSEEGLAKGKDLAFKDWAGFAAAEAAWKASPSGRWPGANVFVPDYPTVLYNAMIHPLAPFAIQGVIWHQGEGGPAVNYRERLQEQVAQWRKLFGQDFTFIWGSMSRNTSTPPPLAADQQSFRSGVNEEFLLASQDFGPKGKAVLVDFFDLGDQSTHWAQKEEGGKRMAGAALAEVYGKPGTLFTGPELVEAKIEGATVRAKFRHVGGGLVYAPSVEGISGFLIEEKGSGQELRWADVKIEGDSVILSHPDVKKPTNAYYGWNANPHETLFNKEGYPAYPFRGVPRVFAAKGKPGPALVELASPVQRLDLNISHVRRDGYLFTAVQDKASGKAKVKARLPKEWKSAKFAIKGQPFDAGAEQTDADGYRLYEFDVEINGPAVEVMNSANPPDFSKVDRP